MAQRKVTRTFDAMPDTLDFRDVMYEPTLMEVAPVSDIARFRTLKDSRPRPRLRGSVHRLRPRNRRKLPAQRKGQATFGRRGQCVDVLRHGEALR